MGYSISQGKTSFKIKGENIQGALKAIKDFASKRTKLGYFDAKKIANAKTLDEAFKELCWKFKYTEVQEDVLTLDKAKVMLESLYGKIKNEGASEQYALSCLDEIISKFPKDKDVIGITQQVEYLGEERIIFNVIAPFVEEGSFIEIVGEDGETWRWVFEGGKCEEKKPKIKW